eukprot:tig00000681_g3050.t1
MVARIGGGHLHASQGQRFATESFGLRDLFLAGRVDEALDLFEAAAELDAGLLTGGHLSDLLEGLFDLGRADDARKYFELAANKAPGYPSLDSSHYELMSELFDCENV